MSLKRTFSNIQIRLSSYKNSYAPKLNLNFWCDNRIINKGSITDKSILDQSNSKVYLDKFNIKR